MAGHRGRFTASFRAKSRNPDAILGVTPRVPSTALRFARNNGLQRAAKVLEAVQALFNNVKTRRVTEPNSAIVAKGSTRNDSNVGFAQQTIGEILGGESELADV